MKFKYILCGLLFVIANSLIQAQIRAYVSSKSYDLKSVDVTVKNITFTIDDKGSITGFHPVSSGNIDYYDDQYFDRDKLGKIKRIGSDKVDYWDHFDEEKDGKVKSVGNMTIDYWDRFDKEKAGKVKKIGNMSVDYWDKEIMDNSKFGKLKSIGDIAIDYGRESLMKTEKFIKFGPVLVNYWNDSIIDKHKFGKIKSVEGNSQEVEVVLQ